MSPAALSLVELEAYDPDAPGVKTLRWSDGEFNTGPAETPASTPYDVRVQQAIDVRRDAFAAGATSGRSRISYGDVVLENGDGELDALFSYGISGRNLTVRKRATSSAYPSGFATTIACTAEQPESEKDLVRIRVRDRQADLDLPFQSNRYAGDNVAPDGLEGGPDDIKGNPKPVCLGECFNVPAIMVNGPKQIFQVHDGAAAVPAVYDAGVPLGPGYLWTGAIEAHFGSDAVRAFAHDGAGTIVVVGDNGKVSTSTDGGATWTAQGSGFSGTNFTGAAFGAGLFAIVGVLGRLFTSPDGVTWTSRTSGFGADDIEAICWADDLTLFLICGQNNRIATSPDGITFTSRTSAGPAISGLHAITFGGGLAVIVGESGDFPNGGLIQTSPDGTTWTLQDTDFAADAFNGVAWGNDLYVAIGGSSIEGRSLVATSADGVTWAPTYAFFEGDIPITDITFGAEFVAVAGGGRVAMSADGLAWSKVTTVAMLGSPNLEAVGYADGVTLIGGLGGFVAATLTPGYTSEADLLDDALAPAAGRFLVYPAGGYFRIGSPPFGQITADVVEGANDAARYPGAMFVAVMTRAGKSAGSGPDQYVAGDATTLDGDAPYVLGTWEAEDTTFAAVLDKIAGSTWSWWGADVHGAFRIQQFLPPIGSPVRAYVDNDLLEPPARIVAQDESKGLPSWCTKIRYAKNYTVQAAEQFGDDVGLIALESDDPVASETAGSVSLERRTFLAREFREATAEDAAVKTVHLLAAQTIEDTLIVREADAITEAERRQDIRGVLRHPYQILVPIDDGVLPDLGEEIDVTHARHGMSAGVALRVFGVAPDSANDRVTLTVWR